MTQDSLSSLGEPDIKLAGFQLWVHGHEFPQADDYWDGNWLQVTAHCGDEGASVFARGPIVGLSELYAWKGECEQMQTTLKGEAKLECLETGIEVILMAAGVGHITLDVSITPNPVTQKHWFQFEIDQSYLTGLLSQLAKILASYPIKDAHQRDNQGTR